MSAPAAARTFTDNAMVMAVAFTPDGQGLAAGSYDHDAYVKLWNAATGELKWKGKGHDKPVLTLAISPDGQTLASGSIDKTVRLWDAATGTVRTTLSGHAYDVHTVAFSADGRWLASAGRDKTVRLWDLAKGDVAQVLQTEDLLSGVVFSPDSSVLAATGHRTVFAWRVGDGTRIDTVGNWEGGHKTIAFSPDGQRLATGSDDKAIRLGGLQGDPVKVTGHRSEVLSVAFHPAGQRLASGSKDYTVRLWNVDPPAEVKSFTGHSATVYSVAFSPDGQWLASGSEDKTVRLWPLT